MFKFLLKVKNDKGTVSKPAAVVIMCKCDFANISEQQPSLPSDYKPRIAG
jgi:hypothetical protein